MSLRRFRSHRFEIKIIYPGQTSPLYGWAWGMNSSGQVTGEILSNADIFVWQNGVTTDLGPNRPLRVLGTGKVINNSGLVGAMIETIRPSLNPYKNNNYYQAQLYGPGVNRSIGPSEVGQPIQVMGINSAGDVVGYGPYFAWIDKGEVSYTVLTSLGGPTYAIGLNDSDQIVGCSSYLGSQFCLPVIWNNNVITQIPLYPGDVQGYVSTKQLFFCKLG